MAAPLDSLALAVEAEVPAFEFRYDSIAKLDVSLLLTRLAAWRRRGGRYLSLQLPDLRWRDGILEGDVQIARARPGWRWNCTVTRWRFTRPG